jgi:hypothetical protein
MLLISRGDFGFGRIRAGMVRIRRSRTGAYRVAKPVFYVTGSILTCQAQTFPIRELQATRVARFFWHPIASRREIGRSDERHSRRHSKNEFPHALPPSRLAVASVVRGSSATLHVTHITKALDVTDITNGAFHVSRVPGIAAAKCGSSSPEWRKSTAFLRSELASAVKASIVCSLHKQPTFSYLYLTHQQGLQ